MFIDRGPMTGSFSPRLIKSNLSRLPTRTLLQNANRLFITSVVLFSVSLGWTQVGTDRANAPDLWELAQQLAGKVNWEARNVQVLPVKGDPRSLLRLSQKELDDLRAPLLQPLKTRFNAPNRVGLYLFKGGSWVVENFNDQAVQVNLNGEPLTVDARGWLYRWK
jgi:hypothetical protein